MYSHAQGSVKIILSMQYEGVGFKENRMEGKLSVGHQLGNSDCLDNNEDVNFCVDQAFTDNHTEATE